jgi:hypothetical protein
MVEGVKYQGFLSQTRWALKKYKDDKKELKGEALSILSNVGEHFIENSMEAGDGVKGLVQLVHTLFEVAAAVTNLMPAAINEEDEAKIKQLNDHAMKGLEMIGAEDKEFDFGSDDDE